MINRDIYVHDPENNELENKGVAEVKDDQSEAALKTLRYELRTFVCDGEYEAGLNKIMSAYLTNLRGDREQPGEHDTDRDEDTEDLDGWDRREGE